MEFEQGAPRKYTPFETVAVTTLYPVNRELSVVALALVICIIDKNMM